MEDNLIVFPETVEQNEFMAKFPTNPDFDIVDASIVIGIVINPENATAAVSFNGFPLSESYQTTSCQETMKSWDSECQMSYSQELGRVFIQEFIKAEMYKSANIYLHPDFRTVYHKSVNRIFITIVW